jgi:hypothetical protein
MVATTPSQIGSYSSSNLSTRPVLSSSEARARALLAGEILLETASHTAWGASVTARMYLPMPPHQVWNSLTDYPRWVSYLPDISQSRILSVEPRATSQSSSPNIKRIYQAASKTFLFLTAQVEVYLRVVETPGQRVQFCLESGSFNDFLAEARLSSFESGTLLTYFVQATPTIPVPSWFIQQAIQCDLPANLRQMRQALCRAI